jgi:hypothetical protein
MENEIIESPNIVGALAISKDDIQDILLDVYRETGQKISKDDPVLAVAVSSRMFIERLSGIIKLDIEACYGAWERVINDSEVRHLDRVNSITSAVDSIEEESKAHIKKLTELVSDERRTIIEEGGRAKESFYREAEKVLSEIKADLKAQTASNRPVSKPALIGFSFLGAIILSVAFCSGSYMYLKYKAEQDLYSVLLDTKTLMQFTEKTISNLPTKAQRDSAQKRYLEIVSKQQQE